MLTIGSLFSGIGGLELGLEWAGLGPVLWQVEKDPFCRAVLAKHYPEAKRFDDVCTVGATELASVDLICGGFPCQDVSSAGRREGLAGKRSGLWSEFARIVAALLPRWVVVENVTSGASRWLDEVVRQLGALGYECLPVPLLASDLGALHRRARVFVVAHLADQSNDLQPTEGSGVPLATTDALGVAPGSAARSPWHETPKHEEAIPRVRRFEAIDFLISGMQPPSGGWPAADTDRELGDPRLVSGRGASTFAESGDDAQAPADDVPSRRSRTGNSPDRRRGPACGAWGTSEPDVVPVVHGLSGGLAGRRRRARIRALGNSVVPQCAEVVGWVIRELAGLTPGEPRAAGGG